MGQLKIIRSSFNKSSMIRVPLSQSRRPIRAEPHTKYKADNLCITPRSGFDAIGFEISIVHPPAGGRHRWTHLPPQSLNNGLQVGARTGPELFRDS
jgi:hypothetical protein